MGVWVSNTEQEEAPSASTTTSTRKSAWVSVKPVLIRQRRAMAMEEGSLQRWRKATGRSWAIEERCNGDDDDRLSRRRW